MAQGSPFRWEDSVELEAYRWTVTMMDDSLWEHN